MSKFISTIICTSALLYAASLQSSGQNLEPEFIAVESVQTPAIVAPYSEQDMQCLVDNMYYEAGNQTDAGKIAVAIVTLTRTKINQYPKPTTLCGVVKEKRWNAQRGRMTCQFSWVCQRAKPVRNTLDMAAYARCKLIAQVFIERVANDFDYSTAPTNYHADYVKPSWAKSDRMVKLATVGRHVFYRENG